MERINVSKVYRCKYCNDLVFNVYSNDGKRRIIVCDYEAYPEVHRLLDGSYMLTFNPYTMEKHSQYCTKEYK